MRVFACREGTIGASRQEALETDDYVRGYGWREGSFLAGGKKKMCSSTASPKKNMLSTRHGVETSIKIPTYPKSEFKAPDISCAFHRLKTRPEYTT